MENHSGTSGFQRKREPLDRWASDLREKHGLPRNASLEEVKGKATELLGSPSTAISGAELVLGRRVGTSDEEVIPIILTPGINAEEIFGLLLFQKGIEEAKARKAEG